MIHLFILIFDIKLSALTDSMEGTTGFLSLMTPFAFAAFNLEEITV